MIEMFTKCSYNLDVSTTTVYYYCRFKIEGLMLDCWYKIVVVTYTYRTLK